MKQAEAVFAVATLGTATARDVATLINGDESRVSNATSVLSYCYQEGWLIRREEPAHDSKGCRYRYRYAISAPDTYEELFGESPELSEDTDEAEA